MNLRTASLKPVIFLILFFAAVIAEVGAATALRFEVSIDPKLTESLQNGRLLVVLSREEEPEPREVLTQNGANAPFVLARDVRNWKPGVVSMLDQEAYTFPITNLSELPAGEYFVQAVLNSNIDLRSPNAPGNLFSKTRKVSVDQSAGGTVALKLSKRIPDESLPSETKLTKFVKIQSQLLSEFYGRPIFLRAGIVLPKNFEQEPNRKYPLWVRIGGWGERYFSVQNTLAKPSDFQKTWLADDTPRVILMQLDGAGPLGDPYQVNSANSGPYGDAITQELIPYVEKKFRGIGDGHARMLSGLSTGGWVSLALQIFYPDFFNGTWTFCPDPVDFRAFELVNIYDDENAYVNKFGCERPSERSVLGDVKLLMRREVRSENLLGDGNSWTMSGGQWCTWNATFGPRGPDGRPKMIWDPETGKINHEVAEEWKKYDLRLVLEKNWKTLGPKLQGKLHISVGEADNYFLNNAVHLLDEFLTHADPPFKGRIIYGPGKGHAWVDLTTAQMLKEMDAATGGVKD